MKKTTTAIAIGIGLLALSFGCSSLSTTYDFDPNADFLMYRTFDFIQPPEGQGEASSLLMKRIYNNVQIEMEAIGYKQDSSNPDILIATHVGAQDKINVTSYGYGYGGYGYYGRGWGGYGGGGVDVYQYTEGSLIIDVVEASTHELAWRGTATDVVDPSISPEARDRKIQTVVQRMLADFPPPEFQKMQKEQDKQKEKEAKAAAEGK